MKIRLQAPPQLQKEQPFYTLPLWLQLSIGWFGFGHELIHALAAWLLGSSEINVYLFHTSHRSKHLPMWKQHLITAAPLIFWLPLTILAVIITRSISLLTIFFVAQCFACHTDVEKLLSGYLRP